MNWLPRLEIYRSPLDGEGFTPRQRGILAHLCLEHLDLRQPDDPQAIVRDAGRAVQQALQIFPLALDNPDAVSHEMTRGIAWFAGLPDAPRWLRYGLREQEIMDAEGRMHRVDLLVDEALIPAWMNIPAPDAASGPDAALPGGPCDPGVPDKGVKRSGPSAPGLIAIDYKTGSRSPEHAQQVRRYMRLMAQASGRPVRGLLVYLDERRLAEVPLDERRPTDNAEGHE